MVHFSFFFPVSSEQLTSSAGVSRVGRVGIGERENKRTDEWEEWSTTRSKGPIIFAQIGFRGGHERERARREEGDKLPVVRPGCVCVCV